MLLCNEDNYVYDWLSTLKTNQINSNVLLLIFKINLHNSEVIVNKIKNNIQNKIKSELSEQYISNYEILKIENISSINLNMNTILIGYSGMNLHILQGINFQIMFCYCKNYNRKKILPVFTEEFMPSDYVNESLFIIKKEDPLQIIINYSIQQIIDYLLFYFQQNLSAYSFQRNINVFHLKSFKFFQIKVDLEILKKEKVLTARLAKIIYKISTLDFNISDTKIGLFYQKEFGMSSKTKRLKKYGGKPHKVYCISEWLESKVESTSDEQL